MASGVGSVHGRPGVGSREGLGASIARSGQTNSKIPQEWHKSHCLVSDPLVRASRSQTFSLLGPSLTLTLSLAYKRQGLSNEVVHRRPQHLYQGGPSGLRSAPNHPPLLRYIYGGVRTLLAMPAGAPSDVRRRLLSFPKWGGRSRTRVRGSYTSTYTSRPFLETATNGTANAAGTHPARTPLEYSICVVILVFMVIVWRCFISGSGRSDSGIPTGAGSSRRRRWFRQRFGGRGQGGSRGTRGAAGGGGQNASGASQSSEKGFGAPHLVVDAAAGTGEDGEADATVIFLHGLGDTGKGWEAGARGGFLPPWMRAVRRREERERERAERE